MKVSVCLAAYKGEKFISAQIESILSQLSCDDELIVSDDAPNGETEEIVKEFSKADDRVIYIHGPRKGVVKNFENCMKTASGDVIFLSDQDDVWCEGKVQKVLDEIKNGACLVLHDAKVTDENLKVTDESYFSLHGSKKGYLRNIIKNSYMGCCMAFTKEIAEKALPFPENIPMHDQWIGLTAEKCGKVSFLDEGLILHRQHGNNVTGNATTFRQKLLWRFALIKALLFK